MDYRELGGRTGLRVPVVGLGAWGIGGRYVPEQPAPVGVPVVPNNYGAVTEEEARAVVEAGLAAGMTLVDTAPFYGAGRGEERLGRILKGHDDVIVVTKAGVWVDPDGREGRLFTREVIERQIDESRRRLQRDVLDVELLHSPTYDEYGDGESLEALQAAKAAGKVRYIGVSVGSGPGRDLVERDLVDVLEIPLNLLRPQAAALLPLAQAHGVGIIAREPLANGRLTGRFRRDMAFGPDDRRRFWPRERVVQSAEQVEQLAFLWQDGQRTAPQAAIQWILTHEAVATVIPGAMSVRELQENRAVPGLPPLTATELARVRALHTEWAAM
jgi:aryl-alcohol dehydrogenase-like predicted oxidoreductase